MSVQLLPVASSHQERPHQTPQESSASWGPTGCGVCIGGCGPLSSVPPAELATPVILGGDTHDDTPGRSCAGVIPYTACQFTIYGETDPPLQPGFDARCLWTKHKSHTHIAHTRRASNRTSPQSRFPPGANARCACFQCCVATWRIPRRTAANHTKLQARRRRSQVSSTQFVVLWQVSHPRCKSCARTHSEFRALTRPHTDSS